LSSFNVAEQLTRMPAQPLAAMQIVRLVDDPDASPAELGRLIEMDPALSARVIRLANSPLYSVTTAVRSAARAVLLLGFTTVRGVAAAAASSLLTENPNLGPDDHWAHSVSVAAAASVAASLLGVAENEAFSAGLLHDIGAALLHGADPDRYDAMVRESAPGELAAAEASLFGMTHAEAGAEALELWEFPQSFVQAIRTHHDPVGQVNPLAQAVILGEALARESGLSSPEQLKPLSQIIDDLGLVRADCRQLLERTARELGEIGQFLGAIYE
jgi:putative nucleotidyltransferase with HDIG domain